jgi:GIY-YIG catalytic domain
VIEDQQRDMQWLVDWLADPANARSAAAYPLEGEEAASIGVYAWHGDPVAQELVRTQLGGPGSGPLFVGRANTALNTRIVRDDLRNSRASTFRRSLAALLWDELGLRSRSPQVLDAGSEERLTEWMRAHLAVTIVPAGAAAVGALIEAEARAALDPPLNLTKVRPTRGRTKLRKLRRALLGFSAPAIAAVDQLLLLAAAERSDPGVVVPISRARGHGSRRSRTRPSHHPAGAGRERGA